MDRQAITRHLLSDAQDPYNRKPLTVEMLEPNDALREEIEEWIRQVVHPNCFRVLIPLLFFVDEVGIGAPGGTYITLDTWDGWAHDRSPVRDT